MASKKPTKKQILKERNPKKLKQVLKQKGYKSGKPPAGKEAHHKNPVSKGGKTEKRNIVVISEENHKKIHKNRT